MCLLSQFHKWELSQNTFGIPSLNLFPQWISSKSITRECVVCTPKSVQPQTFWNYTSKPNYVKLCSGKNSRLFLSLLSGNPQLRQRVQSPSHSFSFGGGGLSWVYHLANCLVIPSHPHAANVLSAELGSNVLAESGQPRPPAGWLTLLRLS